MNTLAISITILVASIAISFFYGLITKNYSTVDRLWSLLPGIYVFIWLPDYLNNPRFIIAGVLIVAWGIRLTTNFAIKGGYNFSFKSGFIEEDYRWAYLRKRIPNKILFEVFNLFFISAFQLILIFFFTLPLYFYGRIEGPVKIHEVILFGVFALLLICEMSSDIQQLRYYRRRDKAPWVNQARYKLGFNTFGLWRFSRHPNYFCEISQWVVVSLYLHLALGTFHWSGIGSAVLIVLFLGSTNFAEGITGSKYPRYKEWKRVTSPWFPFADTFFRIKQRKEFFDSLR